MEILIRTLEDELRYNIESNDNDIPNNINLSEQLRNSSFFFPFYYLYERLSLEKILRENPSQFDTILKERPKLKTTYDELYTLDIANPLFIGIKSKLKPLSNEVKKSFEENKINITQILDIEFFEFYKHHFYLFKNFFGQNSDLIHSNVSNLELYQMLSDLDKNFIEDYYSQINCLGKNPDDLINTIDIDNEMIDSKKFSAFMDTEKIHLKLGLIPENPFPVLLYFGYGNYYPFSRQIKEKSAYLGRFNRINLIENNAINLSQIKFELNKTPDERRASLLRLIDSSQQNYETYFKENFTYNQRLAQYSGNFISDREFDNYLLIPENLRTKASALIAYQYFNKI